MKEMFINMKGKKKGRKEGKGKGGRKAGKGGRKGFIVTSNCRTGDFPGGPVVKTAHFTCTECRSSAYIRVCHMFTFERDHRSSSERSNSGRRYFSPL